MSCAEQLDPAAGRLQEFGQQIEDRGLAGAVRPDKRVDLAVMDVEIDIVDGDEAGEVAPKAAGGKHHPRHVLVTVRPDGRGGCARHLVTSGQPLSSAFMKALSPGMVAR